MKPSTDGLISLNPLNNLKNKERELMIRKLVMGERGLRQSKNVQETDRTNITRVTFDMSESMRSSYTNGFHQQFGHPEDA